MGAALVAQATLKWAHVSNDAYRVLTRMAVVAHDRDSATTPARRYFGGHDGLTGVLGRDGQTERTKLRRVREAIAELEQRGAIVCQTRAVSGRNAVYELTLDAVPMQAKPRRRRSKAFTGEQAHSAPTAAAERAPTRQAHSAPTAAAERAPTPYKEEELLEETLEERSHEERGQQTGPPALRVIAGTDRLTPKFVQPSIWPAPVPDAISTTSSTALTPGELARADLRAKLAERKKGRLRA